MPEQIKADITIIGAGPAGLTAALALGKRGIPCLLIDKHHFPRQKICGDGLSGKVVSTLNKIDPDLADLLDKKDFTTASHSVRFFSPSLKMMELSFQQGSNPSPPGFICKRIDFDHFLLEQVLKYPVIKFLDDTQIHKLTRKDGKLILEGNASTKLIQTKLVLFAAGADQPLIRQLDETYAASVEEGIGVRGYFGNVTGSDEKHAIEIHFLQELLPWYLWIFPFADGSANVGLALPEALAKKSPLSLKELLFHLIGKYPHLAQRFAGAELLGKIEANRLPYYNNQFRIAGDNFMLLGDAARLIDPFTGEGIGNAMASGLLASESAISCLKAMNFSYSHTISYEKDVNAKLLPDLATGKKLQRLARHGLLLNLVIGKASRHEKTRSLLSEMLYDTKAKSKLKGALFYVKLLSGL